MCAVETTKRPNTKHTSYRPPLNLSHFLGKHLLFYFLGSRTPDLKLMVGMWIKNLQFESYLRIQKSSESRLNLLKQLGQTEGLTFMQRSVFAAHWMLSGHLSLSSPQSQERQKSGFSSDPFLQVLTPSHMEVGGKHPFSYPDPGHGIFASDFFITSHICHQNLILTSLEQVNIFGNPVWMREKKTTRQTWSKYPNCISGNDCVCFSTSWWMYWHTQNTDSDLSAHPPVRRTQRKQRIVTTEGEVYGMCLESFLRILKINISNDQ